MINPEQFTHHIIKPVLHHLNAYSDAAAKLLLGTALTESGLKYVKQLNDGPALGVFQMEPDTHDDIWQNYLKYRPILSAPIREYVRYPGADNLAGNMYYACGMARVHYLRVPSVLPESLEGLAHYWKDHYNTHLGAGKVSHFMRHEKLINEVFDD